METYQYNNESFQNQKKNRRINKKFLKMSNRTQVIKISITQQNYNKIKLGRLKLMIGNKITGIPYGP